MYANVEVSEVVFVRNGTDTRDSVEQLSITINQQRNRAHARLSH